MKNIGRCFLVSVLFILSNGLIGQENQNSTVDTLKAAKVVDSKGHNKIPESGFIPGQHQIMSLINGMVPGLGIYKIGSDPSTQPRTVIRGLSSIHNNGEVLYVVDGIPCADPSYLSVEDIASIEVLKNLSETVFWGSRGANGVILINTKRPDENRRLNVRFSNQMMLEQPSKKLDLLTAKEFKTYNRAHEQPDTYWSDPVKYDFGAETDWQDEIFRNTVSELANLSMDGAYNGWLYGASFSVNQRNGIIRYSNSRQFSGNVKLGKSFLNDRIKINTQLFGSSNNTKSPIYSDGRGPHSLMYCVSINPTRPVTPEFGIDFYELGVYGFSNPNDIFSSISNTNQITNWASNTQIEVQLSEEMKMVVQGGYHAYSGESKKKYDGSIDYLWNRTFGEDYSEEKSVKNINPSLQYEKTFGKKHSHKIGGMLGWNYVHSMNWDKSYKYDEALSNVENSNPEAIHKKNNTLRYGISYSFDNAFYVDASLGYDHLNLSNNYTTHLLPAINLKWDLKQTGILNKLPFISYLDLHGGYGKSAYSMLHQVTLINLEEILSEDRQEYVFGGMIGFLDGRIKLNIDYYIRQTNEMLNSSPRFERISDDVYLIYDSFYNWGKVSNKGIEAILSLDFINKGAFNWNSDICFAANKNKLTWPDTDEFDFDGRRNNNGTSITVDKPLYYYNMPEFGKFIVDDYYPILMPGYYRQDNSLTGDLDLAEKRDQGTIMPKYELGWNNHFSIKNGFFADLFVRAVVGHKIMNFSNAFLMNGHLNPYYNILNEALEIEEEYGEFPYFYDLDLNYGMGLNQGYFLEDASFVRIENLSVGYESNQVLAKYFKGFKIYLAVNNLYTFTRYTGYDPDVVGIGGYDYFNNYPKSRSYILGLKVNI